MWVPGGVVAVPVAQQRKLTQRSANICAFPECGLLLTAQGTSEDPVVVLGEMAHIVAESPNGPRGDSPLTPEQRNRYENLILLCNQHTTIGVGLIVGLWAAADVILGFTYLIYRLASRKRWRDRRHLGEWASRGTGRWGDASDGGLCQRKMDRMESAERPTTVVPSSAVMIGRWIRMGWPARV